MFVAMELKPNDARARRAIFFLWLNFALHCISITLLFVELGLLQKVKAGRNSMDTINMMNTSDLIQLIFGVVFFIVVILTYIVFIQWFRRAYYNLNVKSSYLSYSEGWAAGYWFIPVINWYYPYRIMKEIFSETLTVLGRNDHVFPKALLRGWWLLFVLGSIVSQVAGRLGIGADTIEELETADMISIAGSILLIPAAILAIRIIRHYEPLQEELYSNAESDDISKHLATDPES